MPPSPGPAACEWQTDRSSYNDGATGTELVASSLLEPDSLVLSHAVLRFDAKAIFGPAVIAGPRHRGGRRWYLGDRIFVGQSEPHGNYFFELVGCETCGNTTLDDTHKIKRRSDIAATPNPARCWECRQKTRSGSAAS